jgi:hypothetical protein
MAGKDLILVEELAGICSRQRYCSGSWREKNAWQGENARGKEAAEFHGAVLRRLQRSRGMLTSLAAVESATGDATLGLLKAQVFGLA